MDSNVWMYGEPTLDDLLSDPLTQRILRHDGLSMLEVRREMKTVAGRLLAKRHQHLAKLSPAA